ncbi:response regulator [Roseimarinus sediminis]|uniref:response regulator n=1 Tax=Roseimarinus sediminis TaxID=1610899 RepID=UPI003D222FF8
MEGENKKNIIIVDDNAAFIEAVKFMLRNHRQLHVSGEAGNVEQFNHLLTLQTPDLVLMDIMLNEESGIAAVKTVKKQLAKCYFIGVSMSDDINLHREMQKAGFVSGILKTHFSEHFAKTLISIANNKTYFPVLNTVE